jgi:predicted outer membrane repeat protein|tara:strand:- start:2512 stop:3714 length:1203 start_codon:yes stop_codon:yes gene_type:complete
LYNEFENVQLKLHPGRYNAHPDNFGAIKFKRIGMGMKGATYSANDAVLDCNQKSCIDIDTSQKEYAPVSLLRLTFTNASANGRDNALQENHKYTGAVIRLVGTHDPSFTGIKISNCVFELNTAKTGGALYADCSEHSFGIVFQDVVFRNNVAEGSKGGGAIRIHNCSTRMERVTFESNVALDGGGGAGRFSLGNLRADALVAKYNEAKGKDGGGAFRLNGTALTIAGDSNVCKHNKASNSVTSGGACLYAEYATMDIELWDVANNAAETNGGAIRCMGSKLNVRNSIFSQNSAKNDGGSISGMLCNSEFIGTTFTNNTAGIHLAARAGVGYGGAIHLGPGSGILLVSSTFDSNTANAGGGAMTCDSCDENAVFYGTSFSKNHARGKVLYPQHLLTTFCFS